MCVSQQYFTSVTKRVRMEGVCHKGVSHLIQGQGKPKVFVVREFHMCYKESSMEGVCHNGAIHLLQREEGGRCMP